MLTPRFHLYLSNISIISFIHYPEYKLTFSSAHTVIEVPGYHCRILTWMHHWKSTNIWHIWHRHGSLGSMFFMNKSTQLRINSSLCLNNSSRRAAWSTLLLIPTWTDKTEIVMFNQLERCQFHNLGRERCWKWNSFVLNVAAECFSWSKARRRFESGAGVKLSLVLAPLVPVAPADTSHPSETETKQVSHLHSQACFSMSPNCETVTLVRTMLSGS